MNTNVHSVRMLRWPCVSSEEQVLWHAPVVTVKDLQQTVNPAH